MKALRWYVSPAATSVGIIGMNRLLDIGTQLDDVLNRNQSPLGRRVGPRQIRVLVEFDPTAINLAAGSSIVQSTAKVLPNDVQSAMTVSGKQFNCSRVCNQSIAVVTPEVINDKVPAKAAMQVSWLRVRPPP